MSAPSPVAETYYACHSVAGSIGGVNMNAMTGGFNVQVAVDDMTNNSGFGFYEDVPTVSKATLKFSCALKGTGTALKSGQIYAVLINTTAAGTVTLGVMADPVPVIAGIPCLAGNFRIQVEDVPVLDAKAGAKITFSGVSQGVFGYAV